MTAGKTSSSSEFRELGSEPCPICGHSDRCKVNSARDCILCFRLSDEMVNRFKRIKQVGECTTYVLNGSGAAGNGRTSRAPLRDSFSPASAVVIDNLALELGVSTESLHAIGVLHVGKTPAFIERDAMGKTTAINRRFADGAKRVRKGDRRGLYYPDGPDGLSSQSDPILIVEGASDTAACLTMGLAVVGLISVYSAGSLIALVAAGTRLKSRASSRALAPGCKNYHEQRRGYKHSVTQ